VSAEGIVVLAERYLATGDKGSLARAVSLLERASDDEAAATARWLGSRTEDGFVVGLTGAPGSGKSTLVDRLIAELRARESDVAVVAVDPTSPLTGGAILGDRVRMQRHSEDPGVYIRSVATRGHLGGLAIAVPRLVALLEGVGFPWVLVETVGVGQVELEITGEADLTVVVLNPGWGDAIQASKAGLMEVADVFVINKADRPGLRETRRDLESMLDLGELEERPPIIETVAVEGTGVAELAEVLMERREKLTASGELARRRARRRLNEYERVLIRGIREVLAASPEVGALAEAVARGERVPAEAARDALRAVVVEPDAERK